MDMLETVEITSGSSFNVITPLFDSYNTTLAKAQVLLTETTCLEADIDCLLKPYRMTARESSMDLPGLFAKGQGEIR
jgi:hypothetical protein